FATDVCNSFSCFILYLISYALSGVISVVLESLVGTLTSSPLLSPELSPELVSSVIASLESLSNTSSALWSSSYPGKPGIAPSGTVTCISKGISAKYSYTLHPILGILGLPLLAH